MRLEWPYEAQLPLGSEGGGMLAGLIEVPAHLDELGAERSHRRVLVARVAFRHDDHTMHAMAPGGKGEALAVIATGGTDHAGRWLRGRREPGEEMQPATHLEGPDGRVVLVLHPYLATGAPGEERPGVLGGGRHCRVHVAGGRFQGVEADHARVRVEAGRVKP